MATASALPACADLGRSASALTSPPLLQEGQEAGSDEEEEEPLVTEDLGPEARK